MSQLRSLMIMTMLSMGMVSLHSQDFIDLFPDDVITGVQPMTGMVYWENSGQNNTDVISLEFSYMLFDEVVLDSGVYNWDAVDTRLSAIASRKHQAIFRFRYVYPGYETSVPDYILQRDDYHETVGLSEGKETHFPDWTNEELKRFSLEFYTRFAERYDNDPRLAFIQVGFGLWAEYHIYDGPFILGETFPSKDFQEDFFYHLDSTFQHIPWSISVDAADDTYTPFVEKPELKDIHFGVFDDSFMHKDHSQWNEIEWNFFGRQRYRLSPAGGEFSYYSQYDQAHVLDYPEGPYGTPYETWAKNFHITYMLANDQPSYQSQERIKQASMASGYQFKIVSLRTATDTSVFEVTNVGVAPIYYDAWFAVDGVRSEQSLKLLSPGDTIECGVAAGAADAVITIESDKLVEGQQIEFYGTQQLPVTGTETIGPGAVMLPYPNPVRRGDLIYLESGTGEADVRYDVYDSQGRVALSGRSAPGLVAISTGELDKGIYLLKTRQNEEFAVNRIMIL